MINKNITVCEYDTIMELDSQNMAQFEMLEDFILRSNTEKQSLMRLVTENGRKIIKAENYVGTVQLNDGTVIEILPKTEGKKRGDTAASRKLLYRMLSAFIDVPYEERTAADDSESTFLEFFISVFVRETMKIIKSGLLAGYVSIEENMTAVQGNILFAENIRRNLVHRERLYVRHDVFSPDRAENRLLKSAAAVMTKLSRSHQNRQNLKKILAFLDEVKSSVSYEADFSKCISSRNSKKYTTALNISRIFLKNQGYAPCSGKYVSFALLFPLEEVFRGYITRLARQCRGVSVQSEFSGEYLWDSPERFPVKPDIILRDRSTGKPCCIIDTHWKAVKSERDIPFADMLRIYAYTRLFGCERVVLLYPELCRNITGMPANGCYSAGSEEAKVYVRFVPLSAGDKGITEFLKSI